MVYHAAPWVNHAARVCALQGQHNKKKGEFAPNIWNVDYIHTAWGGECPLIIVLPL